MAPPTQIPDAANILALTTDLIYVYDLTTGANRYANHTLSAQLGYTREELEQLGPEWLFQLLHPSDHERVGEHHRELAALADGDHRELVYRVRHRDGAYRWLSSRDTPYERDEAGQLTAILGTCRDITAQMNLTEGLRLANEELSSFASVASHDLKAPLRRIAAFTDLLRSELGDRLADEASEYLDLIAAQSRHARALLDAIARMARASGSPLEPSPLVTREVVEAALDVLRTDLDDCRAAVTIDLSPTSHLRLQADRELIVAALVNLVSNALKFSGGEAPPRVDIFSAPHAGGWLDLSVRDYGPGIPVERQEAVFEPYKHYGDKIEGEGMGLPIVRRIAQRHGGRATVASGLGAGATFTLRLPAGPASMVPR